MGGDTHRQCWDGRQCCVVMAERNGRKVGTGIIGTEGMGVVGGDTHRQWKAWVLWEVTLTDSVGTEGNAVW